MNEIARSTGLEINTSKTQVPRINPTTNELVYNSERSWYQECWGSKMELISSCNSSVRVLGQQTTLISRPVLAKISFLTSNSKIRNDKSHHKKNKTKSVKIKIFLNIQIVLELLQNLGYNFQNERVLKIRQLHVSWRVVGFLYYLLFGHLFLNHIHLYTERKKLRIFTLSGICIKDILYL